jgi:hypothetical protein
MKMAGDASSTSRSCLHYTVCLNAPPLVVPYKMHGGICQSFVLIGAKTGMETNMYVLSKLISHRILLLCCSRTRVFSWLTSFSQSYNATHV